MRDQNDPSLIRKGKGKGKGKKGANDEYYISHSIESIVTKNKGQKEFLSFHNSNNTPIVKNKENENLQKHKHQSSTHKKLRKVKQKKSKSSNDNEVVKHSTLNTKEEIKSSKKEENYNIVETKKSENNDLLMNQQNIAIIQENNTSLQEDKKGIKNSVDLSSSLNKEIKKKVMSEVEKKSTDNIPEKLNIEDNKETDVKEKGNELRDEIKLNEIQGEINHGKSMKSVEEPVDLKESKKDQSSESIQEQNVVKSELEEKEKSESETSKNLKEDHSLNTLKRNKSVTSESAPTSPVVKKRKRGRPSKSNTASPSPMSPDLIGNNIKPTPEIDYSLYGMLRTSRRHHGTFEKVYFLIYNL